MTIKEYLETNYKDRDLVIMMHLECQYSNITSLEGLELVPNLLHLYCYKNKLSSLKGIETLKNLTTINCISNNINDFDAILGLEKLQNFTINYKAHTRDKIIEMKKEILCRRRKETINKLLNN